MKRTRRARGAKDNAGAAILWLFVGDDELERGKREPLMVRTGVVVLICGVKVHEGCPLFIRKLK